MLIRPTIFIADSESTEKAQAIARQYQFDISEKQTHDWQLIFEKNAIYLQALQQNKLCKLSIDFLVGKQAYRRKQSGRKQEISRACGLHKQSGLTILDAHAGLGRDGFVLACLSAKVLMLERAPVLAILLKDAIEKLNQIEPEIDLRVSCIDAKTLLSDPNQELFDVVYIDPMYPHRQKSALVKQEMRILRDLVGEDTDADEVLPLALTKAKQRVVVKRGKLAPYLSGLKPHFCIMGTSTRFDIYLKNQSVDVIM